MHRAFLCTGEGTFRDEIKVGAAFSQNVIYEGNPHDNIELAHIILDFFSCRIQFLSLPNFLMAWIFSE